jgi:spore coat protein U-like protein
VSIVRLRSVLAMAALGLGVPLAASADDQLLITATVQAGCALAGGALNFGSYTPRQVTDLDATGQIKYVDCLGDLVIELDGGQGGAVRSRYLSSGNSRLPYQIYRNPGRTAVWGTGNEATTVRLLGVQSGHVDVYARIPRGLDAEPGNYTDVINITMTF